jgi:transcriptional regulator with XRE-family HTH domain
VIKIRIKADNHAICGIIANMPASKFVNVLAILRKSLSLKQGELAELAGCSISTIQAIEVNKLKLSKSLASRISLETGADLDWLLANDVTVPMPKHHAGQQSKYAIVSFTVPPELEDPINAAAAARGLNRSQYIVWLVERDLRAHPEPPEQKAETTLKPINAPPARHEPKRPKHQETESPKPRKARSRTRPSA